MVTATAGVGARAINFTLRRNYTHRNLHRHLRRNLPLAHSHTIVYDINSIGEVEWYAWYIIQ
jgi:hypothetical protein